MEDLSEQDVDFESARSGGPGGQHGDRRATAVRLRVEFEDLPSTDEELEFVRDHLPPKNRTKDGELLVEIGGSRSQRENRKKALSVANEEIRKAIEKGRQQRRKKSYKKRVQRRTSGGGGGGGNKDIHEVQKKRRRSETTDDLLEQAYEEAPELLEESADEEHDDSGDDDDEETDDS